MEKKTVKITDAYLRKLVGVPGETQRVAIGSGLSLWVTIDRGGKTARTWYLRYYDADGKQQRSKLGEYPELSLAQAQAQAEAAKKQGKEGIRLAQAQAEKRRILIEGNQEAQAANENTFEAVAESWLKKKALTWVPGHLKRQRERLEGHLYHALGNKPVDQITMRDVDAALSVLAEAGKSETAKRAADLIRNVLEHADTLEMLENSSIINKITKYRREVPQTTRKRHLYDKEMTPEQAGELLLKLEESKGRWTLQTSVAVRLAPYVILRPSELCEGEWAEIDFDKEEWAIPGARMKMGRDHIVPLPRQAVELLREIHKATSGNRFIFPSWGKRGPVTTNALIRVFRSLGYKSTRQGGESFVTHGFRGLASTTLYQVLKYPGDYIEHQLAHVEENKVKAAYNQLTARSYIDERRTMLQAYADYLDALREKAASKE